MIVASAKLYNSDVVLTTDAGFQKLCDKLGVYCHLFTHNSNQFLVSGNEKIIYEFAN